MPTASITSSNHSTLELINFREWHYQAIKFKLVMQAVTERYSSWFSSNSYCVTVSHLTFTHTYVMAGHSALQQGLLQ
jgi:hypothetical protein